VVALFSSDGPAAVQQWWPCLAVMAQLLFSCDGPVEK